MKSSSLLRNYQDKEWDDDSLLELKIVRPKVHVGGGAARQRVGRGQRQRVRVQGGRGTRSLGRPAQRRAPRPRARPADLRDPAPARAAAAAAGVLQRGYVGATHPEVVEGGGGEALPRDVLGQGLHHAGLLPRVGD